MAGDCVLFVMALFIGLMGVSKLSAVDASAKELQNHGLLPPESIVPLTAVAGVAELALGFVMAASLRARSSRPAIMSLAIGLLASFSVYLVAVLVLRGPKMGCGCGTGPATSIAAAIMRNAILLILLSGLFWQAKRAPERV
jgi:hypothetical protein